MATTRRQPRIQQPGVPRTSNELFLDALIRHQIGLLRVSRGTGRRVRELLDASEKDMRAAIRRRLRGQVGLETPAQVVRLERLLKEVRQIRGESHAQVQALFREEMTALALAEPKFVDGLFKTVIPVQVDTVLPAPRLLRSIVTTRPFDGEVLRRAVRRLTRADIERIEGQIRIGLVQGESISQIGRRVVGTAKLRGANGVTEITRKNAELLARTATNAIANQARREYFKENREFFDEELFVATLDAVTTRVCSDFDGDRFPIGEGPIPPLHFGCRSLRVAILDDEALGRRPMKPVTERMLVREFAAQEDLGRVTGQRRANLPRGTKGTFDAFARRRTRELIGRVPAKVDYERWLGRQSAAFQDDVLGNTKGALFRRGGLTLDKFVEQDFSETTLSQLARTEAAAFRAANLDPEDFL